MTPRLAFNEYGKSAVRLVKVERSGAQHRLHDLTVDIQFQGDFEAVHLAGDNATVLPTDTMKNTVYVLARQGPVDPPEGFGERLGQHFLKTCPSAHRVVITLAAHRWDRASVAGVADNHTFLRGPAERRLALVTVEQDLVAVEAGIEGLGVLRTSGSGFTGYLQDPYTTLEETTDRILATEISARWRYDSPPEDYGAAWLACRTALVETFARHRSESVQQTLYAMGTAAINACAEMAEIRVVLPNQHHLPVDLSPFGLENPNEIFVATREPYGRIEAVIAR